MRITLGNNVMIIIRDMAEQDHAEVLSIAARLPEWFDGRARELAIPMDLRHQRGYVAELDGEIVGFVTDPSPPPSVYYYHTDSVPAPETPGPRRIPHRRHFRSGHRVQSYQ